jgi:pimeloyl-ACP methyl ester carboxylesterase
MRQRLMTALITLTVFVNAPLLIAQTRASQPQEQSKPAPAATPAKNDYSNGDFWLCRPGRQDACAVDLTTTVVAADGKLTTEPWSANAKAPIDCFYVYPTVSTDPTPNSDMVPGPEEKNVVRAQFARFASQCRVYAPVYRQITLTALRAAIAGNMAAMNWALAYNDVADAWHYYLEHDNGGRGVVLIGHSQGSIVLTRLIREEIDGKPVQSRIVSALLLGTSLPVPKGKDVGGTFQHMQLCRSASQTGCVITYASFRSNVPPPANSHFGRVSGENMVAGCTNPAALAGGSGELHAYLGSRTSGVVAGVEASPRQWVTPPQPITTLFVSVPGMLTAECVANEKGSYLAITVHGDPAGPRASDIIGDVVVGGEVQANWGLHLVDVSLAMGNLLDIVGQQSKSYLATTKK